MSDCFIGEIRIFGGTFPPQGWAMCNGQLLLIRDYQPLYSLIGTMYGGDGQTTFALPDLRGRLPMHRGTNPRNGINYPMALKSGEETVALDASHLPMHSHLAQAYSEPGDQATPQGGIWASTVSQYTDTAPNGAMNALAVQPAGGAVRHDNLMPFMPLTFIINTLDGVYPIHS